MKSDFVVATESVLARPLPVDATLTAVLLVSKLPGATELRHPGRRLEVLRVRWLSLPFERRTAWVAPRFPGTRQRAIVAAVFGVPVSRFADLLTVHLGAWSDVQVHRGGLVEAFTVREEHLVSVGRLTLSDGFGEMEPLSVSLREFLDGVASPGRK